MTKEELGKKIVYLETIEEQIDVLESLSIDRIVDFLSRVDHWQTVAQEYVTNYLAGKPRAIQSKGLRFPSRHPSVITHRDRIFYNRMREYLTQGDAVAFVGAPHVGGLIKLLRESDYRIKGPSIPEEDS